MKALGRHIVCEFSGCDPTTLSDVDGIHAMMVAAAKAAHATIVESAFHRVEPQGGAGPVIRAEFTHVLSRDHDLRVLSA